MSLATWMSSPTTSMVRSCTSRRVVCLLRPHSAPCNAAKRSHCTCVAGGGRDTGGGGTIEDVWIEGGSVGLRASGSQWTFRGVHIRNSKLVGVALHHGGTWAFSFLGLTVSGSPVAVSMVQNQATLFVDCVFDVQPLVHSCWSQGSGIIDCNSTAIAADNKSQVYLERVQHMGGASYLFKSPLAQLSQLPQGKSYYVGRAFEDGETLATAALLAIPPSRTQTPLRARPSFEADAAAGFVNVLEHGCKGDWKTDDTACLQAAIDASPLVFLPYGTFRVTDTLRLTRNTKLVGEGLSRIVLSDNATGFADPNSPRAMVATPDDADAEVAIADVRLTSGAGNAGAVLLSWAVGIASSLWDVHIVVGSGSEGAGGEGIQGAGEV